MYICLNVEVSFVREFFLLRLCLNKLEFVCLKTIDKRDLVQKM